MKLFYFTFSAAALLLSVGFVRGQTYTIAKTGVFAPNKATVLLLKEPTGRNDVILFQTNLRVNTDGSPLSYHPFDPRGQVKALNNICNAIAVRKENSDKNLCFSNFDEAIGIFEKWRDSGYETVPENYRIKWENVLSAVKRNGKNIPCVLKTGPFAGYFGSMTALKNGLTGNKGECGMNDQLDAMKVPALVLPGGENVLRDFGANVGDLLVAYNPENQRFVSAIIGDSGPKDNLGEGSVYLNMKLLGKWKPPANRSQANLLSIRDVKILVAIIPSSHLFETARSRPFTAENIDERLRNLQGEAGFETPEKFLEFMKSFQPALDQ